MDCVEDPSLFDLTKAMVDPEPNAEFSLCGDLSSPVQRGLHRRASVFKATACADVFVFEILSCSVLSTRMSTDNEDDPLTVKLVAENERLRAALAEARCENAKVAFQKTEHVDFCVSAETCQGISRLFW